MRQPLYVRERALACLIVDASMKFGNIFADLRERSRFLVRAGVSLKGKSGVQLPPDVRTLDGFMCWKMRRLPDCRRTAWPRRRSYCIER